MLQEIELTHLRPSSTEAQQQRRKAFNKTALAELAESIKTNGVVQPIVVRKVNGETAAGVTVPPYYEIVAGERRFVAAGLAKLETIPANVRELTDEQVVEIQLIENLQREDLHPMHEAESYDELVHKYGHAVEELVARIGKSRTYVYNRLKLTSLSPTCRKAFYANKVSASIAEKLARIPLQQTQDEALKAITENDWSYRRAAEIIADQFMLKLAEASFPKDIELAGAGPCGTCPKRTGNQPELFADIKSADVCTDTVCFAAKTRAHGQRLAEEARDRGQTVITGAQAKKVVPNGIHGNGKATYVDGGYVALDDEEYVGGKHKKISTLVPKDAPRTLVVDGETGRTIEVVARSLLPKEARDGSGDYNPRTGNSRAAEKKKAFEHKVIMATYAAVRPKLKPARLFEIAASLFRRLEHDALRLLCKVRDFQAPTRTEQYRGKVTDWEAVGKGLEKMSEADLQLFINDCIYVREIVWPGSTYRDMGVPKIVDVAKKLRIDVAKIRRELAPKKKPAKKKARK